LTQKEFPQNQLTPPGIPKLNEPNGSLIPGWPPKPGIAGIPGIPLEPPNPGIPPYPNPAGGIPIFPKPDGMFIDGICGIAPPAPPPEEELNDEEDELNELDESPFFPWITLLADFCYEAKAPFAPLGPLKVPAWALESFWLAPVYPFPSPPRILT